MLIPASWAGQFRTFVPIDQRQAAPEGFRPVDRVSRLDPRIIEHAIRLIAANYHEPGLRDFLGDRFIGADRLVDDIQSTLPPDARMRIIAVRGAQVLEQYERPVSNGRRKLHNVIAATVVSQLEVSDPAGGLQVFENTSEWVLEIGLIEALLGERR